MRIVHYLNQFFGGLGSEEKADLGVTTREGPVGPGQILARTKGVEVAATVICGDNFFAENLDAAGEQVVAAVKRFHPDAVLAGPAFNAGRYGVACGHVCQLVQEQLGIPAVTGMFEENAGVEIYRRKVYIIQTGERATGMEPALRQMATLAAKVVAGEAIGPAEEEGYLPRGVRRNAIADRPAGERAVAMLLRRLSGQPFRTELPLPPFDQIQPAAPVSLRSSKVALVTTGGVVPKGNPDRMPVGRNTAYFRYNISDFDDLSPAQYEVHHAGYETKYGNDDPDRILPLDAARELEREGFIRELHSEYFVTSGQGAMVQAAIGIGRNLAAELKRKDISAVILTAT